MSEQEQQPVNYLGKAKRRTEIIVGVMCLSTALFITAFVVMILILGGRRGSLDPFSLTFVAMVVFPVLLALFFYYISMRLLLRIAARKKLLPKAFIFVYVLLVGVSLAGGLAAFLKNPKMNLFVWLLMSFTFMLPILYFSWKLIDMQDPPRE